MLLKSVLFSSLLTVLCFGMLSRPAYAYLDPGTGSMIIQILLGGIAGAALVGRFYWNRFLILIGVRAEEPVTSHADERVGDDPHPRTDR